MAFPRLEILYPEGVAYLGFAKKKFRDITTFRLQHKIPSIKRVFKVADATITLYSSQFLNFVRIEGGTVTPLILFTDGTSGWGYDYITEKIQNAAFTPAVGSLNQGYNGRCQVDDLVYSTYQDGWKTGPIDGLAGTYLGGLNAYEAAFFLFRSTVYLRIGGAQHIFWLLPTTILDNLAGAYGSLFGLPTYNEAQAWNQYRGAVLYTLNPANGSGLQSWTWVPSFFTEEPQNDDFMRPGWYYGSRPMSEYGFSDPGGGVIPFYFPLTKLNIELKAVLDSRAAISSGANYGWCEHVTLVGYDDKLEIHNDLYFYLQHDPLPTAGNGYTYHERIDGTTGHALITVGADLPGFSASFVLRDVAFEIDKVDMWSLKSWVSPNTLLADDDNAVGIVITGTAGEVLVYRYKGYQLEVLSTTGYHSHSVSRNGQYLAVFFGAEGVITGAKVFNLFGVKVGKVYTGGGFTEVRDSSTVNSTAATQGVFIPYREDGFVALKSNPTGTANVDITDYNETFSSLGTLAFYKDGVGPVSILKVSCDDGVHATYETGFDECFGSEIIIAPNDGDVPSDRLVGAWDVDEVQNGIVRGNFYGVGASARFSGAGIGKKITLSTALRINLYGDLSGYTVSGLVGDLVFGAGFTSDGELDPDSAETICGDPPVKKYSVGSTCGQNTYTTYALEALAVSGTDAPIVGDTYSASGGIGPYTFSFDSGSIDPDTGEILSIDACSASGDVRTGIVSVTDDCGQAANMEVRLPDGVWVQLLNESTTSCGSFCTGQLEKNDSCGGYQFNYPVTYIGAYKYSEQLGYVLPATSPDLTICYCLGTKVDTTYPDTISCSGHTYNAQVFSRHTYEWQCP